MFQLNKTTFFDLLKLSGIRVLRLNELHFILNEFISIVWSSAGFLTIHTIVVVFEMCFSLAELSAETQKHALSEWTKTSCSFIKFSLKIQENRIRLMFHSNAVEYKKKQSTLHKSPKTTIHNYHVISKSIISADLKKREIRLIWGAKNLQTI